VNDHEGNKKTADTKVYAFGVHSEQSGYRFRLNGSFTNQAGNAGARFRFQAQSKFDLGAFSLPYAYGWVSFLNNIFTVNGGLVDSGAWESGGAILNEDLGEGLGALVKISPLDGLDLGLGAYVISQQGSGDNNKVIVSGSSSSDFSKLDIGLDRLKYTLNTAYAMPDVFKATLVFRTNNQAGNADSYQNVDREDEKFDGREESARMIVGARLLAVKDLTAIVEADIDKLEDYGDNGVFNLYETVGYKLGNLGFGLNAAEYFRMAEKTDMGIHFNPWVSYSIDSIVPRLDLNYFLAGTALVTGTTYDDSGSITGDALPQGKYHRKVFAYKNNGTDTDNFSVFAIRPSVTFNVDSKTFVEIGDLIAIANGPEGAFGDAGDPKKASNLSNVFYIDFKWSF
jgi:hypothetical protein